MSNQPTGSCRRSRPRCRDSSRSRSPPGSGVLGGPALLLLSALFSYTLPTLLLAAAIIGFIGGFVTLVATMGNGGDDDWNPDNGAVV